MSFRVEEPQSRDPRQSAVLSGVSAEGDLATAILQIIVQSSGNRQDAAKADAAEAYARVQRAREEIQAAMQRAAEAEEHASFWSDVSGVLGGDVAAIAGVVAAVALAVATGGAGAPAIVALVAAGLTVGAKAGEALGADPRLTAAMGVAGGVLGLFAGNAAGAGTAWTTVAQVGSATQGAASAGSGGATVAEGHFRGAVIDERANARDAQGRQNDAWLSLDLAIASLDRACRDVARAQSGAAKIESTENAGATAIIARMGAA
ncbi:MAG TPA: hypothetical protein VFV94_02560 [Polyangiaceae bacterium]|nr:hypothetical protein [Polyangiaceae bacterium]